MWYYNGEIIKTPKVMTIRDKRYSKEIFQDSSALSSLGIKPYRSVVPDSRYYLAGSYSVDTSGAEVVGTYAGTAKDLANLRTNMLSRCKKEVNSLLAEIDWYWIRASKSGGASVPSAIATYSAALYSEYNTKKTEIAALNTLAKIKEYEARAYTEVRKVEVYNEDGTFKEYHASNTTSHARGIDMCTHFSVHPDNTDAGQVSLTAD
jgi:hypothetical protein|tara:strand:- start:151 stop:768 length:618 start_codon:yes stop_codon:yes gene_type:complete